MSISTAESVIMEALWKQSPLTAEDIVSLVAREQEWTEATVRTLINRLLKKNAIAATKDGRKYLYRPVMKRADWVQEESQSLLDRLFDGRLAPLVTHFSQRKKLSRQDIRELKRLIGEIENGR
ncbi:MAG: BlaI/MecI/CopY family transcriptional regulator [Steroidobacteraceae bacterium]